MELVKTRHFSLGGNFVMWLNFKYVNNANGHKGHEHESVNTNAKIPHSHNFSSNTNLVRSSLLLRHRVKPRHMDWHSYTDGLPRISLGRGLRFFIGQHEKKQEKLEERYKNHIKPLIESLKLWFKRDVAGELRVFTDVRPVYTIDFGHAVYHTNDATLISALEDPAQVHPYAKQHLAHYTIWQSWEQYKTQSKAHLFKVKALWKQVEEIITNEIASRSLSVKPYEFPEPSMPKSWYSMRAFVEFVHARLCEKRIYSLVVQTQDGYSALRDGVMPVAQTQGEDETLSLKQIVEQMTISPKIVEQYKLLEDEKQSLKQILTTFEDGLKRIEEDFDLNGVLLKPDCDGCKDWHPKLS
jgi:hypothetical protein